MSAPVCPYCDRQAELVTGRRIYPYSSDTDLLAKKFWLCAPCNAYVGCHPRAINGKHGVGDGTVPLGRLADAALRGAKQEAHNAFDPIWREGMMRRGQAYAWLAEQLGLSRDDCHIGMFDIAMCARVVEVCKAHRRAHRAAAMNELFPTT